MIPLFPVVVVGTLALTVYQYLHVKSTVNTWNEKKLSRWKPLKIMVGTNRKMKELFSIFRIIMLGVFFVVAVNIWMILTSPDTALFPIEFTLSLIPIPLIFHVMYKTFCLISERAEELYAQSIDDL